MNSPPRSGPITLAMLVVRTPIEEAKLVERFGDDYRRYMARTNRLIPTLRPTGRGRGPRLTDE